MSNLLYKECQLVIHPLYYLMPLFGALLLIPNWVYFVALMYFLFIASPNGLTKAEAQNDTGSPVWLPGRKQDGVEATVCSTAVLEALAVIVGAIAAILPARRAAKIDILEAIHYE